MLCTVEDDLKFNSRKRKEINTKPFPSLYRREIVQEIDKERKRMNLKTNEERNQWDENEWKRETQRRGCESTPVQEKEVGSTMSKLNGSTDRCTIFSYAGIVLVLVHGAGSGIEESA